MMRMETGVETVVSVHLSFVHTLELGHKSSYFQSTNRLDLCPLLGSVKFQVTKQTILMIEGKTLSSNPKKEFNFCFHYKSWVFGFVFDIGSLCVALAILEFPIVARLELLNSEIHLCLCLCLTTVSDSSSRGSHNHI